MKMLINRMMMGTALSLCLPGLALAQDATSSDKAPEQAPAVLENIEVTAIKRTENASEMSTAVTVIDGNGPISTAVDPGAAITRSAPNFVFGGFGQPGNDYVIMRGIGPLGQPSSSLDNTVGFATNGAPTSAFGFPPSLLDVERVEVLRGPQGTLFGRNALGGAVNVVTVPADGEREFRATAEIGTEGYKVAEGKAGGWIKEGVLAGRAAVRYQSQEGDVENTVAGGKEGDVRMTAGRGTLTYTPTDDFSGTFMLGYDIDKRSNNFNLLKQRENFPESGLDSIPKNDRDRIESSLELEKEFSSFTLTSLTNVQRNYLENRYDLADVYLFQAAFGFSPTAGGDDTYLEESENIFSQEVRLNSREDSETSWVAGLHYFRSDYDGFRDADSTFSPYSSGLWDTEIGSQTFAAFGDVSVPVFDKWTVSTGLRVAYDTQRLKTDYTGKGFPNTVGSYSQNSNIDDTYYTGRLALTYDYSDTGMVYASVARGYASGGFQKQTINAAIGQDTEAFDPSTSISYELGNKLGLFDERLEVSTTIFYNDVKKGQLASAIPGTSPTQFEFINQDYESYGVEAETRALLTEDLYVTAGVGYTRSVIGDPATSTIEKGNQVPGAPRWTANVAVDYSFLDDFTAIGQWQYVGRRRNDVQNTDFMDDYHMFNARLAWGDADDLQVYGFANNLLDERPEYFKTRYDNGSERYHAVGVGQGRVLGVGLTKAF